MGTRKHLAVDKETFDIIRSECREEFLRHNPEFKNVRISDNLVLRRMAEYYLYN